jgi:hypothetical protein
VAIDNATCVVSPDSIHRIFNADIRSATAVVHDCNTPEQSHASAVIGASAATKPANFAHWAVARVAKVLGVSGGAHSLSQEAVLAIQELQSHVLHLESFRSLAEDVIVR